MGKQLIPEIYPIYLSEAVAERLVQQCAAAEFSEGSKFHFSPQYEYMAKVLENGDVELVVTYRDRCGGIFSSGPCVRKTVRPYNDEVLAEIKDKRMFSIATEEYYRRLDEETKTKILAVKKEMFGGK